MVIKQEMYSPNTGMKIPRKSPRNPLTRASKPLAHKIYKYININIYIIIREGMREEREERESCRKERERERK